MLWYGVMQDWRIEEGERPDRARENRCPGHNTEDSVNQPEDIVVLGREVPSESSEDILKK